MENLTERFQIDHRIIDAVALFVALDRANTDLQVLHDLLSPDLDVSMLSLQFRELSGMVSLKGKTLEELVQHLTENDKTLSFNEVLIVLARVMAATPHSADVERSISANNLLKTAIRSSLNLETENNYLHIHFNMPPLVEWNPRDAIVNWIKKKNRRHHDLTIHGDNKAQSQPHFVGVLRKQKQTIKGNGLSLTLTQKTRMKGTLTATM